MKRLKISPSDLTWSFSTSFACHRCLWVKYNHDIRSPSSLPPIFSDLAEHQEVAYLGKSYSEVGINGWGTIVSQGEVVTSAPLNIASEHEWYIEGKYDLLGENDNGTYAIFDCKLQGALKDKSKLYAPQLQAYKYALEHPKDAEGVFVTRLGLLAWTPTRVMGTISTGNFGLGMRAEYYPVNGDESEFLALIQRFVKVMEGDIPPSGNSCVNCQYVNARNTAVGKE